MALPAPRAAQVLQVRPEVLEPPGVPLAPEAPTAADADLTLTLQEDNRDP